MCTGRGIVLLGDVVVEKNRPIYPEDSLVYFKNFAFTHNFSTRHFNKCIAFQLV